MKNNPVNQLFGIQYPIIQAGMVWCSGWELASAVSNAGGLGLIGSGSMYPEILVEHIKKCQQATEKPFGVNIPLLYPDIDVHIKNVIDHGVKIIFTSAGSPKKYTGLLKENGVTVVHVVSSKKFALKSQEAGVDAVVAEGFEAGGHNGREETTTMCLIPDVADAIEIPLIAAGGIGSGRAMVAAMALGAQGVQIGSRFAASEESSAHQNFKNRVLKAEEGDTTLTLKQLAPVRMIKNAFYKKVEEAQLKCADIDDLRLILGKGRSKSGIFMGDLDEGELEIGQVSSTIKDIKPAGDILKEIWEEYQQVIQSLAKS